MKKEDALRIIISCAKKYHENLENNNILFVFGSKRETSFFEAVFLPRHFLHLTGIEILPGKFSGSSSFYENCLKERIGVNDFFLSKNGTTEMKLSVLPQLVNIHRAAKMVGDFNFSKTAFLTEKLAGTVYACVGFVRDGKYYMPNTVLREDITK